MAYSNPLGYNNLAVELPLAVGFEIFIWGFVLLLNWRLQYSFPKIDFSSPRRLLKIPFVEHTTNERGDKNE